MVDDEIDEQASVLNDEQKKGLIRLFAEDIVAFSRYVCKDVIHREVPDFHREMYEMALNNDRVLIAAPRGFSKSTILARIYPLWLAVFGLRKDILIISASEGLAIENLRYVKMAVENNPLLRELFGDMTSDKWRENHIELRLFNGDRVTLRAKGAGGQIRGFRPDCLILDDLETDDSVESEEQRKKLKDWVFKACLNCLLPGGQLVVIGTILSQLSLLQDLLETPNGWSKKKYKAYLDGEMKPGKELWPDERPHEWLQERKKEIGSNRFSAEFMNDPMSDEAAPIKDEHIKYWGDESSDGVPLPKHMNAVIAIDPAYSEDAKADYKVAVLVGIDTNQNRYLLNYIRSHQPTGEFMQAIINMWQLNRNMVTSIGIPSSGTEREFFNGVVRKCDELKVSPPLVELTNTFITASGSSVRMKKNRIIAALQPLFENGKYYIGVNHHEAREELLTIGNSRWDDLVDAMAYAEKIITPVYYSDDIGYDNDMKGTTAMAGACEGYGIEY